MPDHCETCTHVHFAGHPITLVRSPRNTILFQSDEHTFTAPLNPLVVPPHLRPFITPTVRRVYIDSPEDEGKSSSLPPSVSEELAKLHAENQTLRSHCVLWRRRAELHGAATLGLLDFARMVRDQAVTLARERDELRRQCQSLKRKLDDQDLPSECVSNDINRPDLSIDNLSNRSDHRFTLCHCLSPRFLRVPSTSRTHHEAIIMLRQHLPHRNRHIHLRH
jgi:hypothetical protein